MDNQIFQKVFDLLQENLIEKWDKIVFRAIYLDGSYNMNYYVKEKGKYKDCYSLKSMEESQIEDIFMDIDVVLRGERDLISDKWSVMTAVFDMQGKFQVHYSYDDISENIISFIDEWDKEYLI